MRAVVVNVPIVLLTMAPLLGHHALTTEFDPNQPITLRGTIIKVETVNPHGWIYIAVKGRGGRVVNWTIETGAPLALARRGITKDTFPIGTEVTVSGYRAKDGSSRAAGISIKFADGRVVSILGSAGDARAGNTTQDSRRD